MKDYEKVDKLKKELHLLIDSRNMTNAEMNGWFVRMEKEKYRFAEVEKQFNEIMERNQKALVRFENRIMDIESELNTAQKQQISNAHIRVGHEQCQYCFQWFNKGGLASHEKYCGMNPAIQEKKPEKAVEKISETLENGELKADQLKLLMEAKAHIEEKLKQLQEAKEGPKQAEEVESEDGGNLPE